MPKTRTTTRKSVQSKNATASKFSRLSTSKQRGLLFVIAFALVGGFFVLRSFALTPHKIIFFAGNGSTYSINADGTAKAVINPGGVNMPLLTYPVLSPDGQKVVASKPVVGQPIEVLQSINNDGTNSRKITSPPAHYSDATGPNTLSWSSDSKQVAYVRTQNNLNNAPNAIQLRVVNRDGTGDHLVTSLGTFPAGTGPGTAISWVPGTNQIVGSRYDTLALFSVNSDGTNYKTIKKGFPIGYVYGLSVSAGSTHHIVISQRYTNAELDTLNLDGSGFKTIKTNTSTAAYRLSDCSDNAWYGSTFAYVATVTLASGTKNDRVYTSAYNGASTSQVFGTTNGIKNACWSRDGSNIAFDILQTATSGNVNLRTINTIHPDGSNRRVVFTNPTASGGFLQSW